MGEKHIKVGDLLSLHNHLVVSKNKPWPIHSIEVFRDTGRFDDTLRITIKQPASPAKLGAKNRAFLGL